MRISDWSSDVCSSDLDGDAWAADTAAAHADFRAFNTPTEIPGRLQLGKLVAWLAEPLPPEAIVTHGAGNYATWLHRFYRFRRFRSQSSEERREGKMCVSPCRTRLTPVRSKQNN